MSIERPPPSSVAVLSVKVEPVTVTGPPSVYRPPPPAVFGVRTGAFVSGSISGTPALLCENTESVIVTMRSPPVHAPPPSFSVSFCEKVVRRTARLVRPSLKSPPPASWEKLSMIWTSVSAMWPSPSETMPPPEATAEFRATRVSVTTTLPRSPILLDWPPL